MSLHLSKCHTVGNHMPRLKCRRTYEFKNTVNSKQYLVLLQNKFVPALRNQTANMQIVWFMQDGATAHTTNIVIDYLNETFISRRYPEVKNCGQFWPAHSRLI